MWSGVFEAGTAIGFAQTILTTVAITTAVWLTATFATAPEPEAKLVSFYRRVRPAGPGWKAVAIRSGAGTGPASVRLGPGFINWVLGIAVVYSTLFALGSLLFGEMTKGLLFAATAIGCAVALSQRLD